MYGILAQLVEHLTF